jgi:hypothetical protein
VSKPEVKRPLERPRHRWEDNIKIIKMDLQEVGSEGMDWIDVLQNRDKWCTLANMIMNLQVS